MVRRRFRLAGVAAGALLAAGPSVAQEFYAGGSIGLGNLDVDTSYGFGSSGDSRALALFGGARFTLGGTPGAGFYVGAEAEIFRAAGFGGGTFEGYEGIDDKVQGMQAELHLGYAMDRMRFYGFVGRGRNDVNGLWIEGSTGSDIYGIGAELGIRDNLALRVEHAISRMQVDACSSYEVDRRDFSVGLVFGF